MQPIFDDQSLSLTGGLVSLAYPLGDLLLLFMLVRLVTSRGARTPAYRFLVTALVGQLTFNTGYALLDSYATGGYLDFAWFASTLAWTAAALHPSMRTVSEVAPDRAARFSRWRLALLAATSLLAPAVLAVQGYGGGQIRWQAITIGAVVLFLLVLARMSGLLNQVQDQAQQLEALAHHDGLTRVPNRRAWDLELAQAMAGARRSGTTLAVALLDLDHFKSYNDTNGHQAGDALLTQAAAAWREELRAADLIARYGGEEFTVLIQGLSGPQAAAIVDRLRTRTPFGQTFSAGVAVWDGGETPQHLVGRADAALYEAKRAGRDRVVIAGGGSASDATAPQVPVAVG
jgi:diguanylate cyclase (GGDEF)-like protein